MFKGTRETGGMPEYDVAEAEGRAVARIVKSAVSPRPIAWISTVGTDGVDNLAPFSSFNYVGSDPPVLVVNSRTETAGGLKDTTRNILDTGEYAVNAVTHDLLEPMDETSAVLPPEASEFDHADVARAPCRTIEAPRVRDAAVSMECTLLEHLEVHNRLMVIGDVDYVHVADRVVTDGEIDMRKLDTVGRLGGPYYTRSDILDYERKHA